MRPSRAALSVVVLATGCAPADEEAPPFAGAVVALQDQAAMGFLDADGALLDTLDLATEVDGVEVPWMVHNVQITPDGRTALATAMAPMGEDAPAGLPDQLLVVDLVTRAAIRRCDLDIGAGVAHVVTDGATAWVTAYDQDRVLVVDVASCDTVDRWPLPSGTGPHGIRRDVDGDGFFVAGYQDGALLRLSATGDVTAWALPAPAVQVAVIPDGSAVLATLMDTAQVARLDLATDELAVFDLPDAVGPAQVYPSPDGGSVWVADQGRTDVAVPGREVYRVDARTGETLARVVVHEAPHGIVVSPDGGTVWTTTLGVGTVDRIDVATATVVSSTSVGPGPNGISLSGPDGAMP